MNPHKYVNCFQPKKQPDSVISVNQKPTQNIKITEKDCTDLQSLVKKSVDDINILFSLKQIQSSFTNIDTIQRKNQSLSVEKTIQRKFNSKATLNETTNTINVETQKQNYTLNINNFINISNKTKKQQQQSKYNYDDSICDNNILTTSMNNTARLATIDNSNSNSNRTSRKSFGEKGKEIYKHNTKVFDGSNNNNDKKKNQTKESLRNYVNVKHKGTKKGTYKGDECNNSINESGFIKMKNEICDNNNNKVGNDNISAIINGNNSYRSSKCNSNNNTIKKGVSNGSINFNSANTSKLTFNKVASQYQQHKVNIQSKHNKNKHQTYNPFNNNTNNNNTIDCNISINSKKSNEHILSHTLNQTETSYISNQINNNAEHSISLLSTQTPLPNDSIPHQNIQPKNPFQKYISKNIIKVQKARSSSIVFDNTTHNNTNTNSHSIKSKSPHIPLTTPNTPSKHNPSPLRKPSSSLLFSTQNYHSIINKIYTKEFPYKTFTTNDILKLMLFLNEYLIYTNALKDLNNMKILSSYSQLLSKNINIEHPRIEHIDLCKYDKFITSAKVIQRKWRERFVKKHISNNTDDEVSELKRMMFSKYIMKMGFKLKKVTGLFNSVVEGFGEIENDTNTTEMLCSVIKLITGNISTNEKHLLYKEYINNIILHQM